MKQEVRPADPDVKVPAGVKAAAAKAQAAYDEVYKPKEEADQDAAAKPEDIQTSHQAPEVAPAPSATSRGNDEDQSWEHKYKSMKGRFDTAQSNMMRMSEQINNLQTLLATKPPAPAPLAPELNPKSLISSDEEREYGSEFLGVVGRKAQEQLHPVVSKLEAEITELKQQLGQVGGYVATDARGRMEQALDERCPAWREVNFDPKFFAWLALPDPYSGAIRHSMLKAAYERNSTPQVLAFFNGFLSEEAAMDPAEPGPDQVKAASPASKVPLEKFAAPGRAKTAAQSVPAEKPLISRAQIVSFYAEVKSGKYKGNTAEKERLEEMIFAAQREGRITD